MEMIIRGVGVSPFLVNRASARCSEHVSKEMQERRWKAWSLIHVQYFIWSWTRDHMTWPESAHATTQSMMGLIQWLNQTLILHNQFTQEHRYWKIRVKSVFSLIWLWSWSKDQNLSFCSWVYQFRASVSSVSAELYSALNTFPRTGKKQDVLTPLM